MSSRRDVVILGAGLAGLTASYHLRDLDIEVLDAESHVGGRTRSMRWSPRVWLNFGAQYILPDKVRVMELADELGVPLVPVPHVRNHDIVPDTLPAETSRAVRQVENLLAAEQSRPRSPTDPELDDVTFGDWLGELDRDVLAVYEHWTQSSISGSITQMSLYGALVLWGANRSAAFSEEHIPFDSRGECVVAGGTNELTKQLARAIGNRVSLGSTVTSVQGEAGDFTVQYRADGTRRKVRAQRIVSALPAPIAARVIHGLPEWKRRRLREVPYGRFIATPIVIRKLESDPSTFALTASRPDVLYNTHNFEHRTPSNFEDEGGCFHSFIYDHYARVVWHDSDDSIKSGAVWQLLRSFPHYAGRIEHVGIQRWRYGNPQYYPGRMKVLDIHRASCDGVYFCGDYTDLSNTEGAVRSGDRVGGELSRDLGLAVPS